MIRNMYKLPNSNIAYEDLRKRIANTFPAWSDPRSPVGGNITLSIVELYGAICMWQATATEGVPVYLLWFKDEIAVRMHQNPFEIVLIEAVDRPVV